MNQTTIGANLNEAHMMLTTSSYDDYNKKVIARISREHRPEPHPEPIPKPTWWQTCWSYITYPFRCCYGTKDDIIEHNNSKTTNLINSRETTSEITPNKEQWVDTGLNKIPQNEFEKRLQALQAERDKQDREFLQNVSREDTQNQFNAFNKKRNEEVNEQFRQMQQEKGY